MSKKIRTAILLSVLLLLLAVTVGSAFAGPYWYDPPTPVNTNGKDNGWGGGPAENSAAPWKCANVDHHPSGHAFLNSNDIVRTGVVCP